MRDALLKSLTSMVLKPPIETPYNSDTLSAYNKKNGTYTTNVLSGNRALHANRCKINASIFSASSKLAIVYMCGNGEFAAYSLMTLKHEFTEFLRDINIPENAEYHLICQDYRGRGFNQAVTTESFENYPLAQDAKDQAALLKSLLAERFCAENILVIGHSPRICCCALGA